MCCGVMTFKSFPINIGMHSVEPFNKNKELWSFQNKIMINFSSYNFISFQKYSYQNTCMLWNVRVKTLPGTVVNFSHMHWKLPKTFWLILTNFDLLGMIKINLYAPHKLGEGDQKLLIPCPYIFENLKYWIRYKFF